MSRPEAPFEEPWQAQLFALTVALNEAGQFTWSEWAEVFGPRVKDVSADRYWETWSEALVVLLEARGIAEAPEIMALTRRWQAAARATPHGKPILLSAADPVTASPATRAAAAPERPASASATDRGTD